MPYLSHIFLKKIRTSLLRKFKRLPVSPEVDEPVVASCQHLRHIKPFVASRLRILRIFKKSRVHRFIKRRCTAFLLSDFLDKKDFRQALTIANRKHDMVAIQVYDRRLAELPDVGLMKMKDNETGQEIIVDTSSRQVRREHAQWWKKQKERLADTFNRSNVDAVSVRTDGDYVAALMSLFAKRN